MTMTSPPRTPFRVGVEAVLPDSDWWSTIYGRFLGAAYTPEVFRRSLAELGADFTLFYDSLAPRLPEGCRRISELCETAGIDYLFNNTYGDIYGPWEPGLGRAEYSDQELDRAAKGGRFRGVILDEVEHRQIHGIDTGHGPYFADVRGKTLPQCYEAVLAKLQAVTARYRARGGTAVGEMVFPVMAHTLARAGVTPAPKFISESFPAVFFAIAAGAARQYGTELWVVHDFWSVEPFWAEVVADSYAPGCSPEAYRASLQLAYWLGADAAYTEALHNLLTLRRLSADEIRLMQEHPVGHRGARDLQWLLSKGYMLNAYGKMHRWFVKEVVEKQPRAYSFRDIRPRIAIVRFPDTCWIAPSDPSHRHWFKGLYGPGGPAVGPQHTAWIDLWHVLTHGVVPRGGLSLFCEPYGSRWLEQMAAAQAAPDDYPYAEIAPFCPLDGVLVFDHLAGARELAHAELVVLTGDLLSEGTLQAALASIAAGADGLALPHLLPPELATRLDGDATEIAIGKGRLLVTREFAGEAARQFLKRHLGPADAIRYDMGTTRVDIRRCNCGRCLLASAGG